MSMDKENQKTKSRTKAGVNAMYGLDTPYERLPPPRSEQDSKLDTLILELQSVNVNIDQERKERRTEMDEIKSRMEKLEKKMVKGDGGNGQGNGRRKFTKCATCEQNHTYCTHCSKCGSGDHKYRDCPN